MLCVVRDDTLYWNTNKHKQDMDKNIIVHLNINNNIYTIFQACEEVFQAKESFFSSSSWKSVF